MDWERDRRSEKFDRAKLERDIAIIDANKRCAIQKEELDNALQVVKDDPSNQTKLDALKIKVKESKNWGKDGANSFATDGSSLRLKAKEIQEEFGFTE